MRKHLRRQPDATADILPTKRVKQERKEELVFPFEHGSGSSQDPFWCPMRPSPNQNGCLHCPTATCDCLFFTELLKQTYGELECKREVLRYHRSDLCAKSILPPFVARLVRNAALKKGETFYDFGCGNGSVLFQVAYLTGNRCVGIEINPVNAKVATEAWKLVKPQLEKRCGRTLDVQIVCGDFCQLFKDEDSFGTSSVVVWAANLLLPKPVNHYLSERYRTLPKDSRVFCFEDLYPHSRSVAAIRDPDAFSRFEMRDYRWQPQTVEWCDLEGAFFLYTRK